MTSELLDYVKMHLGSGQVDSEGMPEAVGVEFLLGYSSGFAVLPYEMS